MLAVELGGLGLEELKLAYLRRKRWEARLLACEIVNALGEAMGGKGAERSASGQRYRKTSADGLRAAMGGGDRNGAGSVVS